MGQVVQENNTLNNTVLGRHNYNTNMQSGAIKKMRQLFCDRRYFKVQLKLMFLSFACFNIYFLTMYDIESIQGNIFTVGILFGLSEVLGIVLAEPLMEYFPDWIGLIASSLVVMILSGLVKVEGLDQSIVYIVFLILIIFIGI